MSYTLVTTQIATALASATPEVNVLGLPSRFTHIVAASEDFKPPPRSFVIQPTAGSTPGPHNHLSGRRATVDLQVVVFYRDTYDREALNNAIVTDYEVLSAVLLDETNWARSTTGIESIALDGGDLILMFDVIDTDTGTMLVMEFPVTYRRAP